MSVLIKDMEKPKSCFAVIDGEFEYCPFVNTDDDCVLLLKKGICGGTWKEQYSKCPLVEAPEPCEDAVSRKSILDKISKKDNWEKYDRYNLGLSDARRIVQDEPSVTPKRKTGKWVNNIHDLPVCDQCGYMTPYDRAIDDYEYGNFCPNCGADMRGEQDDI